MQTYGFMRIYDIKQGTSTKAGAWLDFLLCLSVFAAGVVFSDARVYGIAEILWRTGFPFFGANVLFAMRVRCRRGDRPDLCGVSLANGVRNSTRYSCQLAEVYY